MALETAMITIIDRLIQLVKTRQEDRRKVFADHIEPPFINLAIVHANYIARLGRRWFD